MFSSEQIPVPAPTNRPNVDFPSQDAAAALGTVPGEPFAALPPSLAVQPVLVVQGVTLAGGRRRPAAPVFSKAELGVLGGLQVLLGLLHIGSGGILVSIIDKPVLMLTIESWYLFWGGLLFVSSGSGSMVAEKNQSIHLVKGSMALNIASVLATVVGIILVLWDLNVCDELCYGPGLHLELRVTRGLLGILLMFTLLETWIALTCIYLGWQCQLLFPVQAADFMPNVVPPSTTVLPPPPAYDEIFMNTDRRVMERGDAWRVA